MIDTETTGARVAAGRTARFFAKHQARAAALESRELGEPAGVWLDSQGFIVSRMSTPVTREDAALVFVAGICNPSPEYVAECLSRKHTKFQTCERHDHLDGLPRYRRAEFFTEGGPAGQAGCRDGLCRLWPGTDIFEASVCHAEFALDWTKP